MTPDLSINERVNVLGHGRSFVLLPSSTNIWQSYKIVMYKKNLLFTQSWSQPLYIRFFIIRLVFSFHDNQKNMKWSFIICWFFFLWLYWHCATLQLPVKELSLIVDRVFQGRESLNGGHTALGLPNCCVTTALLMKGAIRILLLVKWSLPFSSFMDSIRMNLFGIYQTS